MTGLGCAWAAVVLVAGLLGGSVGPGWLAPALLLLAGMQMTFTAVVGEYVAAIHGQVRRRHPLVIERERINFDEAEAAGGSAVAEVQGRRRAGAVFTLSRSAELF